jgi:adenine-specific DNA-methyltransferase
MKFFHLSDLHLGKRVNEFSMLEDQWDILQKIVVLSKENKPDAVLIAGDVYDKSMPIVEAVQLLDRFLVWLNELGIAVFIVSGNHDNAERVAFGSELLKNSNVHIVQSYNGKMSSVTLSDGQGDINIWMLPHLKPSLVRRHFPDRDIVTYGRIWFGEDGSSRPRKKLFLSESEGSNVWTWWTNAEVGHNQEASKEVKDLLGQGDIFTNPKPTRLLKRILELVTMPHAEHIILDFFSGSATTAHAVMQLNAEDGGNRRFICVQLPEVCDENSEAAKAGYANICEIGKERIRRAGVKIKGEQEANGAQIQLGETEKPPLDTGFRVFKLDSSNLKQWDSSPLTGENAVEEFTQRLMGMLEILKADRTDVDVVYEVMLKLGQDLCEPIVAIELSGGRQVYGVGADVKFIVCLALNITVEDAAIMADYAPGRIVFADQCFDGSETKSNVKLTLRDKGITIRVL